MKTELKKTGERVIANEYSDDINEFFIYQCHIATYEFAIPYLQNKNVLEFGCGSGYGSHYVADSCSEIVAVDISQQAISYAQNNYKKDNLEFKRIGDIESTDLPFPDTTFDAVISFQVIEHLIKDERFFKELNRVLKKEGVLIVATPDKTSRLFSFQKPWNQYHVREYDMSTLVANASQYFHVNKALYMTARKDLVDMEINRTKKLRLLTLPFTMWFIPEKLRTMFLTLLKKFNGKKRNKEKQEFDFDHKDIYLTNDQDKSINLVIVTTKN